MRKTSFVLFIFSLVFLAGCNRHFHELPSEKVARYQGNYEIIGNEKDDMLGNVSETIFETSDRSNSMAKEAKINLTSNEGEEISVPSGRYQITRTVTGNIYIHDENGDLLFHDILDSSYGVASITVDVNDKHTISIDGEMDQVYVTPVSTQLSTELTAGIWEVGTDIVEGDYSITAPYGVGYLQIFDPNDEPRVYEVIGGTFASTKSDIQLSKGQKLRIIGISLVHFELNEE
ncbi:hypothetical protein [Sporosarcina sp. NPDC096371]|uniref:hypothetical protein n=1 Tax=Sporosarcina sp. NPDC096371 TaxID=3364530 RepID=UPI003830FB2B